MILLPIIIYIFLINLSFVYVFCENFTICQPQGLKNDKSFCYAKYENPAIRIFTRKKRFIVFPNYCSMKITVAMGKHIIVKYPRGLNLSLEVSVYYALPTILEEWYPKQFRRITTPKPTIPKRKNPPIFPRIDNIDESIDYINSPTNEFNNIREKSDKFENIITTTSPTILNHMEIGIKNSLNWLDSERNGWKTNYYLKNSTKWNKYLDKNLLKTISPKLKLNKNFFSTEQYNRDKWHHFNINKTDWSYFSNNQQKNLFNIGDNYLKSPSWDTNTNWLLSSSIKNPQIDLRYKENDRKISIENIKKENWLEKKPSKLWKNDQLRSNYHQYTSNFNHEDIYRQIPKNYPDLDKYKNWKHYRGHRDRRDIYNHLESFSSLFKVDMKACILQSICESKKYLLPPGYSLIQDILRIIFSLPTIDGIIDEYSKVMRDENGECSQNFKELCPFSLLDILMNPDKTE